MERNKETVRKPYSDFYASKRLGITKADSPYSNKPDSVRNKTPCISQSKNIPINKKCNFYDHEARSFFENCDKCFHARPHILVNPPCNVPQIDSGHDLNGNVTYNAYPICNFTPIVNYQSNQHYEISASKCKNIKPRTVYQNQKPFNHKISTPVYSANKFYPSMQNSSVRSSKNYSSKYACSDSYLKITDKPSQETLSTDEKYSKYNVKCTFSEQCLPTDEAKLSDLPHFMHSKLPKDPGASSVTDYSGNQVQKRKHYKKWDHSSVSRNVIESPKTLNDAENMMLFPALPTSCQKLKINSSCANSMPPSEISIENPKLDSSSSGSVNLTSSVAITAPSIPQASYADVIRMSTACSGGVQSYVALFEIEKTLNPEENQIQEKLKEENPQHSSDWVILRLSQIDLNSPNSLSSHAITNSNQNGQNFASPRPIVVNLEKPSFYNSSMPACKSVLSALSSGKKEEIESLTADNFSNSVKSFTDSSSVSGSTNRSSVSSDLTSSTETQLASSKTDSVYSSPSSDGSFDAFKEIQNKDLNIDNLNKKEPPVIILNSSPHENISEISFGIEHEEMLKLCSDVSIESNIAHLVKDSNEDPFSDNRSIVDPSINLSLELSDNVSTQNIEEIEMPSNESIAINGKRLQWKDTEVQFDRSNHAQLTEYFIGIWDELGRDNQTDPGLTNGLQYYHESD